jgi:hypothetical protein
LKSRVAGDGLDIVTLLSAFRSDNPKKGNVGLALLMVGGVTLLDLIGAQGTKVRHNPQRGERRSYRDRTGFPKGIAAVKGIAKNSRLRLRCVSRHRREIFSRRGLDHALSLTERLRSVTTHHPDAPTDTA